MGCVRFGERSIAGTDFQNGVGRAASALASLGLTPGDGVAILLRNEPTFPQASMAAAAIGCYSVPVNWHAHPEEVRYILEDSSAKALVVHADLYRIIAGIVPEGVDVLVVETPAEVSASYNIYPTATSAPSGCIVWDAWTRQFEPRNEPAKVIPQTIYYTSGTTGRPKGIIRPAMTSAEIAVFMAMLGRGYGMLGEYGSPEEIRTVVTGPMYHGLPNGHANFAIRLGADVTIMPRFDPEGLLALIEHQRITHLNLVPIMFTRLLALPEGTRNKYDISSLRYVAHGGAPISPAIKRRMIAWWGEIIHEYYASTEFGNITFCSSAQWLAHPGTVGRPARGTDIQIVGPGARALPAGEIGEIAVKIENMVEMTYLNDSEKRKSIELLPGYISAGDVGYLDDEGFLFVSDRNKDMIISGGVNIYPAQIEAALLAMPEIYDCAVFGVPDEEFGEAVHAVIQAELGLRLEEGQVRRFLGSQIAKYLIPKTIEFADSLPRDEQSGKIFKRLLREPFWSGAGRVI